MGDRLLILVVVVVLIAIGAFWRRRHAPREPVVDLDAAMMQMAEEAVAAAPDRYGVTLDYSSESVEKVEGILGQIERDGPGGETMLRHAVRWGAYVGEIIRREKGGHWEQDHAVGGPGSFPLRRDDGVESFPIGWCVKRIQNGEEDNVWVKFQLTAVQEEWRHSMEGIPSLEPEAERRSE